MCSIPVAADGQTLPFKDASFDAVVCQLGLQFFPDPVRGLAEFRRVLRKGSRVAICVISTPVRAPMRGNLAEVLSRFLPELHDVLFLSFLHDLNRLEALLVGAGFHRVERTTREDSFESFADYWESIEAGQRIGETNQLHSTRWARSITIATGLLITTALSEIPAFPANFLHKNLQKTSDPGRVLPLYTAGVERILRYTTARPV
jgi:SAM-dependent methyltransferase